MTLRVKSVDLLLVDVVCRFREDNYGASLRPDQDFSPPFYKNLGNSIFAVIAHDNKELALVWQNVWLDWRSAFGLCSLLICTRSACLNERVCTYRKKAHAWPPTLWRPKMSQRRAQTVVVFYLFTLLICSASVGFNECAFARTNDVYAWFATLLHPMMPQRRVRNTYTALCGIQW